MILKELSYVTDAFSVETSRLQQGQLSVSFQGCADLRVQNELAALVPKIHEAARQRRVHLVYLNLGKLEFLSSGCFKSLCSWVKLLLGPDAGYKISILLNPKYLWQAQSLNALRMLAPGLVTLQKLNE
jgi:hypothetical protein